MPTAVTYTDNELAALVHDAAHGTGSCVHDPLLGRGTYDCARCAARRALRACGYHIDRGELEHDPELVTLIGDTPDVLCRLRVAGIEHDSHDHPYSYDVTTSIGQRCESGVLYCPGV